jgi:hypothetical protein
MVLRAVQNDKACIYYVIADPHLSRLATCSATELPARKVRVWKIAPSSRIPLCSSLLPLTRRCGKHTAFSRWFTDVLRGVAQAPHAWLLAYSASAAVAPSLFELTLDGYKEKIIRTQRYQVCPNPLFFLRRQVASPTSPLNKFTTL